MGSEFRTIDGKLKDGRTELHSYDDQVVLQSDASSLTQVTGNAAKTHRCEVKQLVREITSFLRLYRWMIDAYVSDFFLLGHWDKLLPSWRSFLQKLSAPDMANLLDGRSHDERVWPLSLLCYKTCIHRLSLDRRMQTVDRMDISKLLGGMGKDADTDSVEFEDALCASKDGRISTQGNMHGDESTPQDGGRKEKVEFMCGQYHELYHIYRRHVKPKKQHEIYQLGQVIKQLSECCQCEQIVDIGAGLGHLSRLLTFGQGLKVTTVEATNSHAPKASTFDRQMNREIKRKKCRKGNTGIEETVPSTNEEGDQELPSHIVHWIEPSVSMQEFLHVLNLDICNQNSEQTDGHAGENFDVLRDQNADQTDGHTGEKPYASREQNSNVTDGQARTNSCAPIDQNVQESSRAFSPEFLKTQRCSTISDFRTANTGNFFNESVISLAQNKVAEKDPKKRIFTRDHASGEIIHHDKVKGEASSNTTCAEGDISRQSTQIGGDFAMKKFVLCGLHACGNLSSTMLKLFVNCPLAVGVSSVGCCYMKLSCHRSSCHSEDTGYPMSETLKSLPDHELSYTAREMACHFVDSYAERLKENRPNLIVHSYRAALQQIILEKDPNFQRGAIKITMKKAEEIPFHKYAEVCLKKLDVDPDLSEAQLHSAQTQIGRWRDVVAFYTLRLALAPVIETLILLDRQLYLWEYGLDSVLVPVFDPSVSPRNFVLLAKKS
ncbi:uncharacterized protein LOC135472677 isoform X2 [Liolophura sinensis]|uniref:uncharacterized protein LOC135472677 isoform X2 n=1 Tax=Liolophura sinensis TaxID=3198878 RepID=UPI0031587835